MTRVPFRHAIAHNDHLIECIVVFLHADDGVAVGQHHRLRLIAYVGDCDLTAKQGGDGELAVDVGHGALRFLALD